MYHVFGKLCTTPRSGPLSQLIGTLPVTCDKSNRTKSHLNMPTNVLPISSSYLLSGPGSKLRTMPEPHPPPHYRHIWRFLKWTDSFLCGRWKPILYDDFLCKAINPVQVLSHAQLLSDHCSVLSIFPCMSFVAVI